MKVGRRLKLALGAMAGLALLGVLTHLSLAQVCRMKAPAALTAPPLEPRGDAFFSGKSFTRIYEGIREVHLVGEPAAVGAAHGALLRERMLANETELWRELDRVVPLMPARVLLLDLGRFRYRNVDQSMPAERRDEIAAEANALAPDPFASRMPTYDRLVLLHALYDIALSFEHSPLVGCSTFGLGPGATKDGHTLLARAFDFEAGDVFDRDKAVYFVESPGRIPFASVAWPGLTGVLSGMNAEGVALVVHGGRAREARTEGIPVVFSLRDTLERAHDVDEAAAILSAQNVMVSHIVALADAKGHFAVVERAPGIPATVRRDFPDPDRVAVTNHFEGPLAADPKNETVRSVTTTLPRRARLDEMLHDVAPRSADAQRAVAMLRDHRCAGGVDCPLGDRRSIDAFIATHGIVADPTARTLWVSAGPQLSGKFVAFDLTRAFGPDAATPRGPAATIEPDPVLSDGRYGEARARAIRTRGDR
jgi:hypothetical protein